MKIIYLDREIGSLKNLSSLSSVLGESCVSQNKISTADQITQTFNDLQIFDDTKKIQNLEMALDEKSNQIKNLEKELESFRSKRLLKASLIARLCCFQDVDDSKVKFQDNVVQFSGKRDEK